MTMLMALLLWSCTSDDITSPSGGRKGVSLAFNISTGRAGTRMSTDITHKNNSGFRDILSESLRLIPFEETTITSGANPLSAPLNQMTRYEDDKHPELIYYYDNGSLEIPDGTSSFLCYCKEQPLPSAYDYGLTEIDLHFKYGYLTTTMPAIISEAWTNNTTTAADIKFEPVQINSSIEADVNATALATYLTAIANAKPTVEAPAPEIPSWSAYSQEAAQQFPADQNPLRKLFREFVNEGHPIACSSAYAAKWVNWLKTELNKEDYTSLVGDESNIRTAVLTAIGAFETAMTGEEAPTGYPANINLPEGAAVVQWNAKDKVFVPVVETTTIADVNSLNRFVYPPELYYYANSGIKTSPENLYEELNQKTWEEVLAKFDKGLGTVDGSVNSIAINDPLAYAVGNLQMGFYVPNSSLQDAAGTLVPVRSSDETPIPYFPLKSLLISSQHPQGFNFEPLKGTSDEYIAYDIDMPTIVLGSSSEPTPPDSKFTNTLVLQTKDGAPVRFAMEFTNNSGDDFQGINGTVFNGTNFYLVGQIKVPIDQTEDYQKRVFTKNHITKGVVKISSLKEAYTYLPDLLDPSLEVGIQLIPDWIQSTSVSVPL